MKGIIRFIFVLIALALILIAIIPMFLPKNMEVIITKTINAPIHVVYDEVNNIRKQTSWNAWLKQDSVVNITYFSPYVGKDAAYKWESKDSKIGNGEMKITHSVKDKIVQYQYFFEGESQASISKISFKKLSENKTEVKNTFIGGKSAYFERYFNIISSGTVEKYIDNSLNLLNDKLATVKYTASAKNIKPNEIVKEFYSEKKILAISVESSLDSKAIMKAVKDASKSLENFYRSKLKINPTDMGSLIIYYENWDETNKTTKFLVGYPIEVIVEIIPENMQIRVINEGNVLKTLFVGKAFDTKEVYEKLINYAQSKNLEIGNAWEEYNKIPTEKDTTQVFIYHVIKN